MPHAPADNSIDDSMSQDRDVLKAISRVLQPLTRLCIANGVTFGTVEELLKQAFVQQADKLEPEAPSHGKVSRISTVTGLNRREVTRLIASDLPMVTSKPPLSTELFARWTTDPSYRDGNGRPRALKRLGDEPSFESLAQSITRDVHPRSLLNELARLGLITLDEEQDTVALTRTDYVPRADSSQLFELLGANVGDHLNAAVDNVLHDGRRHQEQAIFADELSAQSLEALRPMIQEQWKSLCQAMVPAITALIDADTHSGRLQNQRLRIGLYSFAEPADDTGRTAKPAKRHRRKNQQKETKQ